MMLKENELNIKFINFKLEKAQVVMYDILTLIDGNKVKIKFTTIKKGGESIDFHTFVDIIVPSFWAAKSVLNWYKIHKRKENSGFNFDIGNNNILFELIEKIFDGTRNNPNAEAFIKTPEFSLTIRNGNIGEPTQIPSPVATSDKKSNVERQKYKTCPKCLTKNDKDAVYCKHCGNKFE